MLPVFSCLVNLLKSIICSGVTHISATALYAVSLTTPLPTKIHLASAKAKVSKRVYIPSLPACKVINMMN